METKTNTLPQPSNQQSNINSINPELNNVLPKNKNEDIENVNYDDIRNKQNEDEKKKKEKKKKEEKEKINLPPINRFKYCVKKLKLNINNESSTNKFDEEQMMNMYKELELYNKNKFVF